MSDYKKCLETLESRFGQGKDNIIALATISLEQGSQAIPVVREVDAYYKDGSFYVVTHLQSNKMKQIDANPNAGLSVGFEAFTATAYAENLGWVLDPKNSELRLELRKVFSKWYDEANNEKDENCCILSLKLTKAILMEGHAEVFHHIDFIKQSVREVRN